MSRPGADRVEALAERVTAAGVAWDRTYTERIVDTREELDVSAVQLARPVTDPEEVCRAVVPLPR